MPYIMLLHDVALHHYLHSPMLSHHVITLSWNNELTWWWWYDMNICHRSCCYITSLFTQPYALSCHVMTLSWYNMTWHDDMTYAIYHTVTWRIITSLFTQPHAFSCHVITLSWNNMSWHDDDMTYICHISNKKVKKTSLFADNVIRHNPLLPCIPVHTLPVLNHDRIDHNTKPMEHWCIATVVWTSYYCMTSSLCRGILGIDQSWVRLV